LDALHVFPLRKVDHEPVGDVIVGLHSLHPLQEKDIFGHLSQQIVEESPMKEKGRKDN